VRIYQGPADDVTVTGWEVAGADALREIADALSAGGYDAQPGGEALARARQVEDLIVVDDPDGIRVEIFWGAERARRPFASAVTPGGFVTGEDGVGHFVILARNQARTLHFYQDLLGLKLSDYIRLGHPDGSSSHLTFMHANARHHSLAFGEVPFAPKRKVQHISFQTEEMSDVGFALDRFGAEQTPLAMTIGHHPNCGTFSFYVRSPSGIDVELGWGSREVDDATWVPKTYSQLSDWGHQVQLPLVEPADA
jgi:2,3-dihydroxybiphenyl 1,2-dioxygenase